MSTFTTSRTKRRVSPRRVGVIAMAAALACIVAAPTADAAQGSGNPVLSVSKTTLPATGASTITVTGTDYLVPPHAPGANVFGGVYLFFGWVRPTGGWGPSIRSSNNNDGNYGSTYSYPGDGGDAGTREDPEKRMAFISFTSGGTSGSATPYHMDDNGNWSATMVIYGPTYTWQHPVTGAVSSVNCRQVQCGVFTIGAHGKASATNERFTPISFVDPTTPTTKGGGNNNGGGGNNNGGGGTTPGTTPGNGNSGGTGPTWPDLSGLGSIGGLTPTTTADGKGGSTTTVAPAKKKAKAAANVKAAKKAEAERAAKNGGATTQDPDGEGQEIAAEPTAARSESGAPVLLIILVLLAVAGIAAASIVFFRKRLATSTDGS